MKTIILLLALLPSTASAARSVMEGIPASAQTVMVDTVNARVGIDTTTYGGNVPKVGLFTSSNIVVSNPTSADNCVIYATGSITCLGVNLGGGGSANAMLTNSTDTVSGAKTYLSAVAVVESPIVGSVDITTAAVTTSLTLGLWTLVAGTTVAWTNQSGEFNEICIEASIYTKNGIEQTILTNALCDGNWLYDVSTGITSDWFNSIREEHSVYACHRISVSAGAHACSLWAVADSSNNYQIGFGGSGTRKRKAYFFVRKR